MPPPSRAGAALEEVERLAADCRGRHGSAQAERSSQGRPRGSIRSRFYGRTDHSMGRRGRHHRTDPGQSRSPHNRTGSRCKLPKRESSISCSKGYHIEARRCRRTGPMSTHRHSRLRPGAATLDVVVGPEPGIRGGSNQKRGPYLPCAATSRGAQSIAPESFHFSL